MSHLKKSEEDFITMAEAGFIAINQGDEDAAVKLFRAAELLKPGNSLPRIGLGYLHFLKLELKEANKIFQHVLEKEPENEMAKALIGLSTALIPTETSAGEKLLEEALKKSKDSSVKTMATTALDFIRKFVKKSPSPVSSSMKKHKK